MKLLFISLVKASMSRSYKVDAQNYRCNSHINEWKFLDLTVSNTENDRDSPVSHQRPLPWCRWDPPALPWDDFYVWETNL